MNSAVLGLQHCLEHEIVQARRFLAALQAEAQALETPDNGEALTGSTRQKAACAEDLSKAGLARQAALRELGYSADRQGLDAAVEANACLLDASRQLLELGRRASELNDANGIVIDTYLKHNQQALDTLRKIAGDASLYDASGRASRVPGQRKSIRA